MSTVTFEVTFSTLDLLRDPQVRKALRAREDTYLDNLAWLDKDLNLKVERRRQHHLLQLRCTAPRWAAIRALRAPANHGRLAPEILVLPRQHKIWHCGHGVGDVNGTEKRTPEEKKARKVWIRNTYAEGLVNNTCIIGHRPQQEQEQGKNTRKQFLEFKETACEGDIIFNHCSFKGGITHYGVYTGAENITTSESRCSWDEGEGWLHSLISVDRWIPLPAPVAGTGLCHTLYEVTPKTNAGKDRKNYKNYSIPS